MKLTNRQPAALSQVNEESLLDSAANCMTDCREVYLLTLIAQLLDNIAKGEDMYMIIGATSNKSSFVVTVKHNGTPTSVYGASMPDLSLACQDLL